MAKTAEGRGSKNMPPVKTAKKLRKEKGSSSICSTPGKSKGINCQASSLSKGIAYHNRSYKWPEYITWCKTKRGVK